MGAQLNFGTAGATGGGFSAQPGSLQPARREDHHEPRWQWQARAPKTWKDRNRWTSLWPRGVFGWGGNDGSAAYIPTGMDFAGAEAFEPYSRDGEGCSLNRFILGTCVDASDVPVANAIVQVFRTVDDFYLGQDVSRLDGRYTAPCDQPAGTQCYLVAYKPGSPDTGGTTVNTLTPTRVDGT